MHLDRFGLKAIDLRLEELLDDLRHDAPKLQLQGGPVLVLGRGAELRVVLALGLCAGGAQGDDHAIVQPQGDHVAAAGHREAGHPVLPGVVIARGQVPDPRHPILTPREGLGVALIGV